VGLIVAGCRWRSMLVSEVDWGSVA
jgi:hypothetical protein